MDFTGLAQFIIEFFGDIRKVITSLTSFVAIILGTIQNVTGAVNTLLVKLIDLLATPWPSTPDNLKLATLIENATSQTGIGTAIVYDTFETMFGILAIITVVKLYKLIPFKMT